MPGVLQASDEGEDGLDLLLAGCEDIAGEDELGFGGRCRFHRELEQLRKRPWNGQEAVALATNNLYWILVI